jgi:diguanylate cyclase (GGDEF)-like protein
MNWPSPVTIEADNVSLADPSRDAAQLESAIALSHTGYPNRAHETALDILARARQGGDMRLIAVATMCLTTTSRMRGECEAGIGYGREARTLLADLGEFGRASIAGGDLAYLLAQIGEADAIVEALTALERAERAGSPTETILALDSNAIVLWLMHQLDQALPFAERAVELSRLHRPRLKRPLVNLAGVRMEMALRAGEPPNRLQMVVEDAVGLTQEALALSRADGDGWIERLTLCNIAEYRMHVGDAAGAERALAGFATAAGEATNRCTSHYLHMLGRTRAGQNRLADALTVLEACRDLAMKADDLETAAPCNKDIAEIHARLGDYRRALDAFRTYHDLYVRQASHAAQRRARLYTLEWETERLRASVKAAMEQAAHLTATNRVLAQETERLLRASMEDPLTGLQNRRRLDLAFLEILTTGEAYAIAMIDVDCFKQVNDLYTHPVGDAALRAVAGLLRSCARADDLIVRFGGDEFALLLRGADLPIASAVCTRLVEQARAYPWGSLHSELRVTLSIGVAASHEAPAQEAVLSLADRRLYQAKQAGRDRVACEAT